MRITPDGSVNIKGAGTAGSTQAVSFNGSAPVDSLVINSAGKVGVGTSLPSGNLDVRGLSGTSIIRAVGVDSNGNADAEIFSTGTTGTSRLFFADTAAKSGSIIYSHNNNSFAFATNGGGADVVIDSDGRLLVGTSTSRSIPSTLNRDARIQLEGGDNNKSAFSITNTTNGTAARGANIRTARIRGTGAVVENDTLGLWSFYGHDGTDFIESATIRGMVDGTPNANEMPGRLVFSTTADSASNMTERMRITSDAYVRLASGTGGIQFNGDTAAANALDDYEEGTWTPTLNWTGVTYTSQSGYYTKIGNTVHVQARIEWTANDANAQTIISGLPFTTSNATDIGMIKLFNVAVPAALSYNAVEAYQANLFIRYVNTAGVSANYPIAANDAGIICANAIYKVG